MAKPFGIRYHAAMTTTFTPAAYGPVFAALLGDPRLNPLGPGTPNRALEGQLRQFDVAAAFAHCSLTNRAAAEACLAGIWLRHDFLDESHTLSQSLHTPEGSYWHGIMHRREPDFDNAAYWFRRVGRHPIFESLCGAARAVAGDADLPEEARFLLTQTIWDPFAFIKLCEQCYDERVAATPLCQAVQQQEWQLLFDHCYRSATGS